jgi:hypothetical protein
MKLVSRLFLATAVWLVRSSWSFPSRAITTTTSRTPSTSAGTATSTTVLHISSWSGETVAKDIVKDIQAYLTEPESVEARTTLNNTCLVSGLVRSKERTDQCLFDFLNHQESAFEFPKIVAFVDDAAFAKKRLLSRSARYTGLLDKLDVRAASAPGALPTAHDLETVQTWIVYMDQEETSMLEQLKQVGALAKGAAAAANSLLKNVAVVLAGANELDAAETREALEEFKDDTLKYTIIAVGKLVEKPEGKECYQFKELGDDEAVLPADAVFSREESCRMIAELLQLKNGENRALAISEVYNASLPEVKLIKGLRSAGYDRLQEIEHMLTKGTEVRTLYDVGS